MKRDKEIFDLIALERDRQINGIELIASENFVSDQVLESMGSVMTNKYAEGYPGARYYGGCEIVDQSEQIAIDRLKELYGAEYANVQPHSGAQANMAVFLAVLKPGDTFMGLDLAHGGHLSHGSPVSGDMMGSGTISGPTPDSYGSMLELSWRGEKPIKLNDGSERKFINDNDTVTLKGYCKNENIRIGFGECSTKILPAHKL